MTLERIVPMPTYAITARRRAVVVNMARTGHPTRTLAQLQTCLGPPGASSWYVLHGVTREARP